MHGLDGKKLPELSDTKYWSVSAGYRGLGDAVRTWFGSERLAIVSDSIIWNKLGGDLQAAIGREGLSIAGIEILPGTPVLHADYAWIEHLVSIFRNTDAVPASFGSGTINDLVKRTAFELNVPYLSIATAPSVDGYSSYGAAILVNGFKQTLECSAPRVIFADPLVLSSAPIEMIAAGYGDLASKLTAGSDWILADALGMDALESTAWGLVQDDLYARLDSSREELPEKLFSGLLNTGFAMQLMRSSRPVSGAEHLLSHVWEMENLEVDGRPVLHGNKVALGLLAATAFTEEVSALMEVSGDRLIRAGFGHVPGPEERKDEILKLASHLVPSARSELVRIALEKLPPDAAALAERYGRLRESPASVWKKAAARLIPFGSLREKLHRAGCPVEPFALGISADRFRRTIRLAQAMRNRYSILDTAWDLGVFSDCIEGTIRRFTWDSAA